MARSKLSSLLKAKQAAAERTGSGGGLKRQRPEGGKKAAKAAGSKGTKQAKHAHAKKPRMVPVAAAHAAVPAAGATSALDLAIEQMVGGGGESAYSALVGAFSSRSSALRRRQQEQEGDSGDEDGDSSGDEGEEEEGEEEDGEGEEQEKEGGRAGPDAAAAAAAGDGNDSDDGGSDDDGAGLDGEPAGADGRQDGAGVAAAARHADRPLDTWTRRGLQAAISAAAKSQQEQQQQGQQQGQQPGQGQQQQGQGKSKKEAAAARRAELAAAAGEAGDGQEAGAPSAAAAAPATAASDTWARHVSHELSADDVVALQGPAPRPRDAEEHPDYKAASHGLHWQLVGRDALPDAPSTLAAAGVKERLIVRWDEVHAEDAAAGRGGVTDLAAQAGASGRGSQAAGAQRGKSGGGGGGEGGGRFVSPQQRALFGVLNGYADVVFPCRPYPVEDLQGPDWVQDAYLLHVLNHVAKTADRIKKNNDRLEAAAAAAGKEGKRREAVEGEHRDQGFTRPKALILLPQRNFAFGLVRRLVALAMRETRVDSVQGKEKFVEQFTDPEEDEGMDEKAAARRAAKPAEWRALFGGNVDDHFRLGIKVTRGSIKLFADLFQSDIIVASPLALSTKLAEDAAANGGKASPEVDFLSSIEILVLDRADLMTMQNWSHVEAVVAALNQLPREQHGSDIMRVREWNLAGHARHYRQTVLLSSFLSPDMNHLVSSCCSNHEGRVRAVPDQPGLLSAVVPQIQQLFERFRSPSPADVAACRLEFFKRTVWPRIKEMGGHGQLIFIPHYFDFVRVRNFLTEEDAEFASICEYTKPRDVAAARSRFFHRHRRILLYTERAHFYNRHRIRGIKDVLFYSLPEHAHFYSEILNLLETGGGGGSRDAAASAATHATESALFCKFDVLQLERVVGSGRAKRMVSAAEATFMFC